MNVPSTLRAGDTWDWDESLSDYPATTWTLKFTFYRYGQVAKTVTASASGTDFSITVSAADSAAYTTGDWMWTAYVEKGAGASLERYTVGEGVLSVKPSLAGATATTDHRSYWQKVLDAAEAALLVFAAKGHATITIDGKSVSYKRMAELTSLRNTAARQVAIEQKVGQGLESGRRGVTRFG